LELLNWVLYGGEDFELVLCLPHAIAQPLVEQLDGDAAIVGQITSDLEDAQGQPIGQPLSLSRGFQHFG
jgi:thiamine-monophosphate kinase